MRISINRLRCDTATVFLSLNRFTEIRLGKSKDDGCSPCFSFVSSFFFFLDEEGIPYLPRHSTFSPFWISRKVFLRCFFFRFVLSDSVLLLLGGLLSTFLMARWGGKGGRNVFINPQPQKVLTSSPPGPSSSSTTTTTIITAAHGTSAGCSTATSRPSRPPGPGLLHLLLPHSLPPNSGGGAASGTPC